MRAVKPYIRSKKYELRKKRQLKITILLIVCIPPLIIFYNPIKNNIVDFIKELKTPKSPPLESVPPPAPPKPSEPNPHTPNSSFTVEIQSLPPEATVLVDKKLRGITPLLIGLEKGSYEIAILKEGYKDLRDSIMIEKEDQKFTFTLEKVSDVTPEPTSPPEPTPTPEIPRQKDATGFGVTINSSPAGATIFIDKIKYGVAPLWVFLKKGDHGIKLEKEGYRTNWDMIKVDKDGKKEFYYTLEKE